jgi:hypothetical protein
LSGWFDLKSAVVRKDKGKDYGKDEEKKIHPLIFTLIFTLISPPEEQL